MITIILFAVVGSLLAGYFSWRSDEFGAWATLGWAILALLFGGVLGLFFAAFVGIGMTETYDRHITETRQVVSLRDEQSITGSFFLGSGSVSSDPVFFYYQETAPNTYEKKWVSSKTTTLVEDASIETAHLDVEENIQPGFEWGWVINDYRREPHYFFHVPPGTVIKELKVQ